MASFDRVPGSALRIFPSARWGEVRKPLAVWLAVVYAATNIVFAHAAESRFWEDRRRAVKESRVSVPAQDFLLARLPGHSVGAVPAPLNAWRPPEDAGLAPRSLDKKDLPPWLDEVIRGHGALRDVYLSQTPNAPLVIHIQDLHDSPEAQTHIAALIESLQSLKGVSLVGLEGAQGAFALEAFRGFPTPDIARGLAEHFLQEGRIGGAEFAGLTLPQAPLLWGVEDNRLYQENIATVRAAVPARERLDRFLSQAEPALSALKAKTFSPRLLDFDRRATAFAAHQEPLGRYVGHLLRLNGKSTEGYSNLRLLNNALSWEETLDFKKVESERRELLETLTRRLPADRLASLLEDSAAYRGGRLTYGAYYRRFRNHCAQSGVDLESYGQLSGYIRYVLLVERINRNDLLVELAALEKRMRSLLAYTPAERELLETGRRVALVGRLVRHEFSPADWMEYTAQRAEILALPDTLSRWTGARGLALAPADLKPFEDFCSLALGRNDAMVESLLEKMRTAGRSQAVLVAGGFHTEGVTRLLRRKDVSYVVVTPAMDGPLPEGQKTLDVLARDPLPIEKLFAGEAVNLPAPRPLAESSPSGVRRTFTGLMLALGLTLAAGSSAPTADFVGAANRLPDVARVDVSWGSNDGTAFHVNWKDGEVSVFHGLLNPVGTPPGAVYETSLEVRPASGKPGTSRIVLTHAPIRWASRWKNTVSSVLGSSPRSNGRRRPRTPPAAAQGSSPDKNSHAVINAFDFSAENTQSPFFRDYRDQLKKIQSTRGHPTTSGLLDEELLENFRRILNDPYTPVAWDGKYDPKQDQRQQDWRILLMRHQNGAANNKKNHDKNGKNEGGFDADPELMRLVFFYLSGYLREHLIDQRRRTAQSRREFIARMGTAEEVFSREGLRKEAELTPQEEANVAMIVRLFTPLAARLGWDKMADSLCEMAFELRRPVEYWEIKLKIHKRLQGLSFEKIEDHIAKTIERVHKHLGEGEFFSEDELKRVTLAGRKKSIYSTFAKIEKNRETVSRAPKPPAREIDELEDLITFKAVFPKSTKDSSWNITALKVIDSFMQALDADRMDDYDVRSGQEHLHVTIWHQGRPYEIQLFSPALYQMSQLSGKEGNRALDPHWIYKSGIVVRYAHGFPRPVYKSDQVSAEGVEPVFREIFQKLLSEGGLVGLAASPKPPSNGNGNGKTGPPALRLFPRVENGIAADLLAHPDLDALDVKNYPPDMKSVRIGERGWIEIQSFFLTVPIPSGTVLQPVFTHTPMPLSNPVDLAAHAASRRARLVLLQETDRRTDVLDFLSHQGQGEAPYLVDRFLTSGEFKNYEEIIRAIKLKIISSEELYGVLQAYGNGRLKKIGIDMLNDPQADAFYDTLMKRKKETPVDFKVGEGESILQECAAVAKIFKVEISKDSKAVLSVAVALGKIKLKVLSDYWPKVQIQSQILQGDQRLVRISSPDRPGILNTVFDYLKAVRARLHELTAETTEGEARLAFHASMSTRDWNRFTNKLLNLPNLSQHQSDEETVAVKFSLHVSDIKAKLMGTEVLSLIKVLAQYQGNIVSLNVSSQKGEKFDDEDHSSRCVFKGIFTVPVGNFDDCISALQRSVRNSETSLAIRKSQIWFQAIETDAVGVAQKSTGWFVPSSFSVFLLSPDFFSFTGFLTLGIVTFLLLYQTRVMILVQSTIHSILRRSLTFDKLFAKGFYVVGVIGFLFLMVYSPDVWAAAAGGVPPLFDWPSTVFHAAAGAEAHFQNAMAWAPLAAMVGVVGANDGGVGTATYQGKFHSDHGLPNQDAVGFGKTKSGFFYGVCADGVTANPNSHWASQAVVKAISQYMESPGNVGVRLVHAIQEAFVLAHKRIQTLPRKPREESPIGTTGLAVVAEKDLSHGTVSLTIGNAGNSRAMIMVPGEKELFHATFDDRTIIDKAVVPSSFEDYRELNLNASQFNRKGSGPLRNGLSVGSPRIPVEVTQLKNIPNKAWLLLASDGLFELPLDVIHTIIKENNSSPQVAADALIAEAKIRMIADDVTVLLVDLDKVTKNQNASLAQPGVDSGPYKVPGRRWDGDDFFWGVARRILSAAQGALAIPSSPAVRLVEKFVKSAGVQSSFPGLGVRFLDGMESRPPLLSEDHKTLYVPMVWLEAQSDIPEALGRVLNVKRTPPVPEFFWRWAARAAVLSLGIFSASVAQAAQVADSSLPGWGWGAAVIGLLLGFGKAWVHQIYTALKNLVVEARLSPYESVVDVLVPKNQPKIVIFPETIQMGEISNFSDSHNGMIPLTVDQNVGSIALRKIRDKFWSSFDNPESVRSLASLSKEIEEKEGRDLRYELAGVVMRSLGEGFRSGSVDDKIQSLAALVFSLGVYIEARWSSSVGAEFKGQAEALLRSAQESAQNSPSLARYADQAVREAVAAQGPLVFQVSSNMLKPDSPLSDSESAQLKEIRRLVEERKYNPDILVGFIVEGDTERLWTALQARLNNVDLGDLPAKAKVAAENSCRIEDGDRKIYKLKNLFDVWGWTQQPSATVFVLDRPNEIWDTDGLLQNAIRFILALAGSIVMDATAEIEGRLRGLRKTQQSA